MKKILLFSLFIVFGLRVLADATIAIDNYTADKPIYVQNYGNLPNFDVYCELLANDISIRKFTVPKSDGGYFDLSVGVIPGMADNATVSFTLRAWGPYDFNGYGTYNGSITWAQATGSWNPASIPPSPATGPSLAMPQSLVIIAFPEPSTYILGLMGASVLFFLRRK